MKICQITSSAEYWRDEWFQNLIIFGILIFFQIEEIWKFVNFLSSKILGIVNFPISKIEKISN